MKVFLQGIVKGHELATGGGLRAIRHRITEAHQRPLAYLETLFGTRVNRPRKSCIHNRVRSQKRKRQRGGNRGTFTMFTEHCQSSPTEEPVLVE
jgi:hypothetical protein